MGGDRGSKAAARTRVVGRDDDGRRLDVALARLLDEPRSRAAARIARGEVRVEGMPAVKSQRVAAGQTIEVAEPPAPAPPPAPPPPRVRFEDEHLLVVDKPAGLVVHPGAGHRGDTLVDALRQAGVALAGAGGDERPGVVHRLDRDTSGLLVVAKTDAAFGGLVAALKRRAVTRRYLTLVEGRPDAAEGRLEGPIGRHPDDRTRFAVVATGRPAATRFRVVAEGTVARDRGTRPVSLLECALETGRTHQIRVHLRAYGHPVCGDLRYGASPEVASALGLDRMFLHAARLAFTHPVTGERVALDSPLPDDLAGALRGAGLADALGASGDDDDHAGGADR